MGVVTMNKLNVNGNTYCDTNKIKTASGAVKSPSGDMVEVSIELHEVFNASGEAQKWVFVAAMAGKVIAREFSQLTKAEEMFSGQEQYFV
jgi:hypothetical protein